MTVVTDMIDTPGSRSPTGHAHNSALAVRVHRVEIIQQSRADQGTLQRRISSKCESTVVGASCSAATEPGAFALSDLPGSAAAPCRYQRALVELGTHFRASIAPVLLSIRMS